MGWISVEDELPPEGELVDVWLERGSRAADCYWEMGQQGKYEMPQWHFRNGFTVWRPFQSQDISHWRYRPAPPQGMSPDYNHYSGKMALDEAHSNAPFS